MMNAFFVRLDKRNVRVNFSDILYVEACKNYVQIVTKEKSLLVLISLRQIEEMLPASQFCRTHRSYIVSMEHLVAFDNNIAYVQDRGIPISEQHRSALFSKVNIIQSDVRRSPAIAGPLNEYKMMMETPN